MAALANVFGLGDGSERRDAAGMAGGCGEDARIRVDFAADGSTSSSSSSRPAAAVALHAQPCRGRASTRATRPVLAGQHPLLHDSSSSRSSPWSSFAAPDADRPPKAGLSRRPSAVAPDDGRRYEYAYQIRRLQWQVSDSLGRTLRLPPHFRHLIVASRQRRKRVSNSIPRPHRRLTTRLPACLPASCSY